MGEFGVDVCGPYRDVPAIIVYESSINLPSSTTSFVTLRAMQSENWQVIQIHMSGAFQSRIPHEWSFSPSYEKKRVEITSAQYSSPYARVQSA
ncbi:MAG: hypothetical protein WHS82_00100 [Candidatus Methanosuratincola sp.]